jgi:hypothetical protein
MAPACDISTLNSMYIHRLPNPKCVQHKSNFNHCQNHMDAGGCAHFCIGCVEKDAYCAAGGEGGSSVVDMIPSHRLTGRQNNLTTSLRQDLLADSIGHDLGGHDGGELLSDLLSGELLLILAFSVVHPFWVRTPMIKINGPRGP